MFTSDRLIWTANICNSNFFQSNARDTDITMVHMLYDSYSYLGSDFIGPVGSYQFHFISGAPNEINTFTTLFRPFDPVVWALILASVVSVSIVLTVINNIYSLLNESKMESTFQSMLW